jgi:hypothetical protein
VIWLKRLAPLVALVVIWFGYKQFQTREQVKTAAEMREKSIIIAHLWLGSAGYRSDPARYQLFRDSILKANQLTADELLAFTRTFDDDPDANVALMNLVSKAADSLYPHWDTLWRAGPLVVSPKVKFDSLLSDSSHVSPADSSAAK